MGSNSILWQNSREVAFVLWASMLSPSKEIDLYRNALVSLMEVNVPSFCVSEALVDRLLRTFSSPLPIGAMYVGSGSKSLLMDPSVLLNPCNFVSFAHSDVAYEKAKLEMYYDIAMLRPDCMV